MGKIYIIGLGPGDVGDLTLEAVERAENGIPNFIRTKEHPVIEFFYNKNIDFISFDEKYEESSTFSDVYSKIVKDLMLEASKGDINYWTPGNPMVAESVVKKLLEEDVEVEIISGISFIEPILELVEKDLVEGLQILDALRFDMMDININMDTIIAQVYNSRVISDTKLILSEVYGDDYIVSFIQNAGIKGKEILKEVPIYKLDRIEEPNLLTSLYIPKMNKEEKEVFNFKDIFEIIQILRSEEGCPWDREQTHESMKSNMIEEAYEVVDAIERNDYQGFIEELGDVLLQVIFHSVIGYENGMFSIYDVMNELGEKLKKRHPHVFFEKTMEKSSDIVYNWDRLKFESRNLETQSAKMKDIKGLPSLMKLYKMVKKTEDDNISFESIEKIIDPLMENLVMIKTELGESEESRLKDLVGDILAYVVLLSKVVDINPELALNSTITTMIDRMEELESRPDEFNKVFEKNSIIEFIDLIN